MKKNLFVLLVFVLIAFSVSALPAAAETVSKQGKVTNTPIYVDGKKKEADILSISINNSLYLPLRATSQLLGFKISWNQEDKAVYIYTSTTTSAASINNGNGMKVGATVSASKSTASIYVDGKHVQLLDTNQNQIYPVSFNNSVFLPIRALATSLGIDVKWDSVNGQVNINTQVIDKPKGEKGETGPQGPEGEKGDKGDPGNSGSLGPKGDSGAAGAQGDKGDKGDPGAAGAQGDKGDKGDPGAAGAQGDKGDKGDPGAAGAQGDKGDKGDPGAAGAQGDKGDQGDPGPVGPQGDKGDKGDPGAAGVQGDKGDKGDPGAAGAQGDKGDKGDPGAAGAQGDKGDQGDPGPVGPAGTSYTSEGFSASGKTTSIASSGKFMDWSTGSPYYANSAFDPASGIFKVPDTGRYAIHANVYYKTNAAISVSIGAGIDPVFTVKNNGNTDLIKGYMPILDVNIALLLSLRTVLSSATVTLTGDEVELHYEADGLTLGFDTEIVWSIHRLF